jgi:hypothetical protein
MKYFLLIIIYAIKANKKCSKVWIMLKSPSSTSLLNQWFYENSYNSKRNSQSGEYEWTKSVSIKYDKKDNSNTEYNVTAIKLDETTYFFADKLATLLGY